MFGAQRSVKLLGQSLPLSRLSLRQISSVHKRIPFIESTQASLPLTQRGQCSECSGKKAWLSILAQQPKRSLEEKDKLRFKPVIHMEEKEIKKSGLPVKSGAALSTAVSPVSVAAEASIQVVEHVPVLSLTNNSRRHDAVQFLGEVFRTLAKHQLSMDIVATAVSNIVIALPQPLSVDRLSVLQKDLTLLEVGCKYDADGSLIHFHAPVEAKQRVEHEVFRLFADHGLHSVLASNKREEGVLSILVPTCELELTLEKLDQHCRFVQSGKSV